MLAKHASVSTELYLIRLFLVGQLPHLPNYSYDTGGPIIINRNQFDGQMFINLIYVFHFTSAFTKAMVKVKIYTYLQNKRMRRCRVAPPPPIIFERLKLPQQIIYHWKENLSESPNHQKYWENILVSRFYEQFSRNRRI